jgi:putative FmdB family regulatory protein
MPIYEYACGKCGNEFEMLVRSDTVAGCPSCRSTEVAKKLSVFATAGPAEDAAPMACGTCGDPRGPGSCALN